ncbi:hypothetical protein [Acinetobacter venetianus]|uniref:hypothetical protein n=1 Tax=Acinetobacter venetianus TaxID=52133 RepID=UPI00077870C5|nr:hypothetical protein [Acinetobacter venetianus]KXZ65622.1 hypothetical protein AVENLUH7437_01399 [Acinetobacter venetianus]
MVASTDTKFYVHTNNNAPQLQNAYGCMIDVLDACLVNGFGSQTVATLTASGTTVTATYGSAHNYLQYQVIKLANANQAEFNGEHRILTVPDANTITFELAAVPSVTTATGTITSSLPSLGWLKPFSDTGKAAYRSANTLLASRPYLRVVDALDPAYNAAYAKYAKVGIVEDMTDIDAMLGVQSPFDTSNPNKNWVASGSGTSVINGWAKWYYARSNDWQVDANADTLSIVAGIRNWMLVGNQDCFYIFVNPTTNRNYKFPYGFGTFKNYLSSDMYPNFLAATLDYSSANAVTNKATLTCLASTVSQTLLLQRNSVNDATPQITANLISLFNKQTVCYSGSVDYFASYSLAGGRIFAPVIVLENGNLPRGQLSLINWLMQAKYDGIDNIFSDGGRGYFLISVTCAQGNNGAVILDLGGLI